MMDVKTYVTMNKNHLRKMVGNRDIRLCIIQVGDNPASNSYVKGKISDCEEVGIIARHMKLEETTTTEEILTLVEYLNKSDACTGIIIQLPLPAHIDVKKVQLAIAPHKDVDGFHPMSKFVPCTPLGVVNFLIHTPYAFQGKRALVIGRSDIVGKPLAQLLTDLDCTVTLAHSKTPVDVLKFYIEHSDIVFTAISLIEYFDEKFKTAFKHVPVVIDIGLGRNDEGKLKGNLSTELVLYLKKHDNIVISGIGGVGLLTRLQLLTNTINAKSF